jgi:PASTA domain-containing protein
MRRFFSVTACLCVVLALAGCKAPVAPDLSGTTAPTPVSAPSLTGLSASEASAALAAAGLKMSVTETFSATVPAGQLISQSPAPGANTPGGTSVEVVISKGQPATVVPNVVRKSLAEATSTLTAAGYLVSITRKTDDATAGVVLSQKPAGGAKQTRGTVQITISTGLPPLATRILGTWKAKDGSVYTFRIRGRVVTPSGGVVRFRLTNGVLQIFHPVKPLTADIAWVTVDQFKLTPRTATGPGPTVTYNRVR